MLPIITPRFNKSPLVQDNTVIITEFIGYSMLYLRVGDLIVDSCLDHYILTDGVICIDASLESSEITIIFDRALTIQEIAEELSLKFEYNTSRIIAAINNKDKTIQLALIPRSKRAV
jgi:hypothetical protein